MHHAGRGLQARSYQPTGAIVAAATTSLPEQVGGERNWDYPYSWVRDVSMTMQAFWVAARPDEASRSSTYLPTWSATAGAIRTAVETRAGTRTSVRSPRPSTAPASTPPPCSCPSSGSCPPTSRGCFRRSTPFATNSPTNVAWSTATNPLRVDERDGLDGLAPALHLLARPRPRAGRTDRGKAPRASNVRRAARQPPPCLQPHRPGQRGLGARPGPTPMRSGGYEPWTGRSTTAEAIGTSLLRETSGFGTGLYRYLRLRLVDSATAGRLVAFTFPPGMRGRWPQAKRRRGRRHRCGSGAQPHGPAPPQTMGPCWAPTGKGK